MINSGKNGYLRKNIRPKLPIFNPSVASMTKPRLSDARFAKNMADTLQLILTLILGLPILH